MKRDELEAMRTLAWQTNDWQMASRVQTVLNKLDALTTAATTVRDRLTRLVDGLTNEGVLLDLDQPGHSFNTLGEIQAGGSECDRLCGELGMAIDFLKEVIQDRKPTPAEQGEAAGRQEAETNRRLNEQANRQVEAARARKRAKTTAKTYPVTDAKGRTIRVTIPED